MIELSLPKGPLHVLALGAHPDDIEIGCGGTLLTMSRRSDLSVTAVVMTGVGQRRDEAVRACLTLVPGGNVSVTVHEFADGRLPAQWDAVKTQLERTAQGLQPDIILAPRPDDAHQDHRLLGQLVGTVWRDHLILHYEIPKWDGDLARATHYIGLTAADAHRKVEVLNEAFSSQTHRDWWDDELFLGLMRLRGIECRQPYAEGFTVPKVVLSV